MQTYVVWREAFLSYGYGAPDIIFLCRNPLECAMSQSERHKNSFEKQGDPFHIFGQDVLETLLLWYTYNMRFLNALEKENVIVVSYEDFMAAPGPSLEKIGTWAALNCDSRAVAYFCDQFLEKGLRHQQGSLSDLSAVTRTLPQILDLYTSLERLARKDTVSREDIDAILDRHNSWYADLHNLSFLGRLFTVPKQELLRLRPLHV